MSAPTATPTLERRRAPRFSTTPARLRIWTASLALAGVTLLTLGAAVMCRLDAQVRAIGEHAAPQVATASDIYFALSDMDAQVATMIMLGNADVTALNRLDALRTFQLRSDELDEDLRRAARTATTDDQILIARITDALAVYRGWVWQALAAQAAVPDQEPGRPPAPTRGYYAHASTVLRGELLPAAAELRGGNEGMLSRSYAEQRTAARIAIGLLVTLGGALVAALVQFQRWLVRRHRRLINPALALATLAVAALVIGASLTLADQTGRLTRAQREEFAPYLSLTQAQAISYDAAGDSSRLLISEDPRAVEADLRAKSHCLVAGGACPGGTELPTGGLAWLAGGAADDRRQGKELLVRWNAYRADHDRVVALASAGRYAEAVDVLTGISRGEAAFDIYAYNVAVHDLTQRHRLAYDRQLADARDALAPWRYLPAVLMIFAIVLILLGVGPRLAEYR